MPRKRGSIKGLVAKYGATVRKRYSMVVWTLKRKRSCPRCDSSVRRVAVGIWNCRKCGFTVAGEAYNYGSTRS